MTNEELVKSHINFARKIAWSYSKKNQFRNHDEILSAAYYGLVLAGRSFQPEAGQFRPYAGKFICGQINDHVHWLRKMPQNSVLLDGIQSKNRLDVFEFVPESKREIALLYFVNNLTIKEISEMKRQTMSKTYREIASLKKVI